MVSITISETSGRQIQAAGGLTTPTLDYRIPLSRDVVSKSEYPAVDGSTLVLLLLKVDQCDEPCQEALPSAYFNPCR